MDKVINIDRLKLSLTAVKDYVDSKSTGGSGGGSIVVDSALSATSTNPVQNKVVNAALNNKLSTSNIILQSLTPVVDNNHVLSVASSDSRYLKAQSGKGLSTNDFTDTYKSKLDGIATGATKTTVDSALSSTSTNPVLNKVVNTALASKFDTSKVINSGQTLTTAVADNDHVLSAAYSEARYQKALSGKGLSTNDFTDFYKNKLDGIDTTGGSTVVQPTYGTYTVKATIGTSTTDVVKAAANEGWSLTIAEGDNIRLTTSANTIKVNAKDVVKSLDISTTLTTQDTSDTKVPSLKAASTVYNTLNGRINTNASNITTLSNTVNKIVTDVAITTADSSKTTAPSSRAVGSMLNSINQNLLNKVSTSAIDASLATATNGHVLSLPAGVNLQSLINTLKTTVDTLQTGGSEINETTLKRVSAIESDVSALKTSDSTQSSDIASLKNQVTTININLGSTMRYPDNISDDVTTKSNRIDLALSLKAGYDLNEAIIDNANLIAALNTAKTDITSKINNHTNLINNLTSSVNSINTNVTSNAKDISNLQYSVTSLNTTLGSYVRWPDNVSSNVTTDSNSYNTVLSQTAGYNLNVAITSNATKIAALTTLVNSINTSVSSNTSNITKLTSLVNANKSDIANINAKLSYLEANYLYFIKTREDTISDTSATTVLILNNNDNINSNISNVTVYYLGKPVSDYVVSKGALIICKNGTIARSLGSDGPWITYNPVMNTDIVTYYPWTGTNNADDKVPSTACLTSAFSSLQAYTDRKVAEISSSTTGGSSTATQLGTLTVGSSTKPIYLNAGKPVAISTQLGSLAFKNEITEDTVADLSKLLYLNSVLVDMLNVNLTTTYLKITTNTSITGTPQVGNRMTAININTTLATSASAYAIVALSTSFIPIGVNNNKLGFYSDGSWQVSSFEAANITSSMNTTPVNITAIIRDNVETLYVDNTVVLSTTIKNNNSIGVKLYKGTDGTKVAPEGLLMYNRWTFISRDNKGAYGCYYYYPTTNGTVLGSSLYRGAKQFNLLDSASK